MAIASGAQRDRLSARYVAAYNASLQEGRGRPDGDFTVWREYPDELKPRSQKVGKGLYTAMGVPRGDKAAREAAARRNLEFFGAPTVLWLFVHKGMLPFSAQDGGILLDTLMLSAQAHGVDTCPIGTLAVWRGPIDEEFDIPKDYQFITGLAFGYASDAPANQFRAEHPTLTVVPAR